MIGYKLTLIVRLVALFTIISAVGSRESIAQVPDAIFYNGRIVTVDAAFSIHQAFAIKEGRFVAVGSDAMIRGLAGPGTRQTDLRGHTVIPGLMDTHNHQYHAGLVMQRG